MNGGLRALERVRGGNLADRVNDNAAHVRRHLTAHQQSVQRIDQRSWIGSERHLCGKIENDRVWVAGRRLLINSTAHSVRRGNDSGIGCDLKFRRDQIRVLNWAGLRIKRRKEIEDARRIEWRLSEIERRAVDNNFSRGRRSVEGAIQIGET